MATCAYPEVLLATDSLASKWSILAWDTDKGSSLGNFKGQAVAPHCLCLQGNHTLIGASESKPVLQLWPLAKKEGSLQKIVCPGKVSALAVSPDGLFCIAAIADKLYIWELSAGGLLDVFSGSDEVKVIRFTDCGSQFVTGSTSGVLLMWDFANAVSRTGPRSHVNRARHRKHAHTESITDLYIGCGGPASRVVSCSSDNSCKMWDLVSGELMKTFIYEEEVHCVIMDQMERTLCAGLAGGNICRSPLHNPTFLTEDFPAKPMTKLGEQIFRGHKDTVTCLTLTRTGHTLASGSNDGTIRLWSMDREQFSVVIHQGGPVTNLLILPRYLLDLPLKRYGPSITFQHQINRGEGHLGRIVNVSISDNSEWPQQDDRITDRMLEIGATPEQSWWKEFGKGDKSDELDALRNEVANLKKINKELYNFLAKKVVSDSGGQQSSD